MKLKIDDFTIRKAVVDIRTFQKGVAYFNEKRVEDISYDEEHRELWASVEGNSGYYQVMVAFDAYGNIKDYECDCPAYSSYKGACKHVAAVLFEARKRNIGYDPQKEKLKKNSEALFKYFKSFGGVMSAAVREAVSTEIVVDLEQGYRMLYPSIELKLGLDRLYVVKNISSLIENLQKGQNIEFGKGFTLDLSRQYFSETDGKIIAILTELYENERLINDGNRYGYYGKVSNFKGKKVKLSQTTLKRIFEILENRSFTIITENGTEIRNAKIYKEVLPVNFSLGQKGKDLQLVMDAETSMMPVTSDGEYFLYDGKLYKVPEAQRIFLIPFYNTLMTGDRELVFEEKDKARFASEILPFVEKTGSLKIAPAIQNSFYKEDVKTKVYFEKSGKGIAARVEFDYGEVAVNPFDGQGVDLPSGRILVRDIEQENRVLDFFRNDSYKKKDGMLHIEEEEDIFDFVVQKLPLLQETAEVYYSEQFKAMTVRDPGAFKGKVRLNDTTDMLEFSFQHENVDNSELKELFSALRLKKKYYRLKDGSFISLEDEQLRSFSELTDSLGISEGQLKDKVINLPKYRALYLDSLLKESELKHFERNQAFKRLVQNVLEPQDMEFELPEKLQGVLRDYQQTGFKWLRTLAVYGLGGILADDMGLGKTLQAIAFIQSIRSTEAEPCLVVAPTSLVYSWAEEVRKFAPDLKVVIVSGPQRQRIEQLKRIKDADMVVTSYPLIRRDIELYEDTSFSCCFIDEAQHIKNHDSVNARSVKRLKAKGYFALTGTPIENSLAELWSIFDFVMPGYLRSYGKFSQSYEKPIVKEENSSALGALSCQIKPFILRRLKKDVLKELPEKIETRMTAEMTDKQKKIYLAYLNEAKKDFEREIADKGFERSRIMILSILTRLRQICCHPAMFIEGYGGDSGKLLLLEEILEDALAGGHRILLFSQFTTMLDIIRKHIEEKHITYFYLDGSIKAEDRMEMVKSFNEGEGQIFLISLKAGGTGLNLTGADTVIHFDPWWNPAVEEQATDRAYRIGQKNKVQVIKLVTQGTIEEKVYELQEKKKRLIESVIQPGETFVNKLSVNEIRGLFE